MNRIALIGPPLRAIKGDGLAPEAKLWNGSAPASIDGLEITQ